MKTLSDKPINLDLPQYSNTVEAVIFHSEVMKDFYKNMVYLAQKRTNIIITGEQGTGKHHIARMIHSLSPFSDGPFNNIYFHAFEETIQGKTTKLQSILENGAYLNSEEFSIDFLSGGTLFLNAFSKLSHQNRDIFFKFLNIVQQRIQQVKTIPNFRIIISVEKNPSSELEDLPFWNDLLGQFQPAIIHLPPLRERCEDITVLIDQFLIDYARKNDTPVHAVSYRAAYKCISYYWPGNIRQLKNTIEHTATIVPPGSVITSDKLPFSINWKSPSLHINSSMEHNESFIRAEKSIMEEFIAKSDLTKQELNKTEYEFRIIYKNSINFIREE